MKIQVLIVLVVSLFAATSIAAQQSPPVADDCKDLDVVNYAPPASVLLKERIVIRKATDTVVPSPAITEGAEKSSPQGTARLIFLDQPNVMKKGPWNTKARIVGNKAHSVDLMIEFRDHANQAVHADWLNEKLLFLRVWWGRLVSTDLILNVETGVPVYAEEASYHTIVMPCDEKRRTYKQR